MSSTSTLTPPSSSSLSLSVVSQMEVVTSCGPPRSSASKQGVARQCVEYQPSIWGDYFITHPSLTSESVESETWMRERVKELIVDVKRMMMTSNTEDSLPQMRLIDSLQRLGVDYHFEQEIDQALHQIHENETPSLEDNLHQTALRFRLLRQHRYNTTSKVFERFKNGDGSFNGDVKGLLSLYEASYLSVPGEDVLDEAMAFSRKRLESLVVEPRVARQVRHALETPLHRRMKRLEARLYIAIYEEEEERDDCVVELAKLDFHLLQLLHRQEIRDLSMWWRKLGLSAKLTFARDRLVECYFWILGLYFEPDCSRARMMATKVIALLSVMDDLYDAYGTLDELECYTHVIQRWSVKDASELEECFKCHFLALDSIIDDFKDELAKDGLSFRVHYLKEAIKVAAKAWLQEAKWREFELVPSLEDHLSVSLMSSGYSAVACASFVGIGVVANMEVFDWLMSFPRAIKAISLIARLMDDVVSYELETDREHVASTILCYVKEHGTSIREACEKLLTMVEDAWKDLNEDLVTLVPLPSSLFKPILNLARMMETIYRKNDGYTNPTTLKGHIDLLLIKPIPL